MSGVSPLVRVSKPLLPSGIGLVKSRTHRPPLGSARWTSQKPPMGETIVLGYAPKIKRANMKNASSFLPLHQREFPSYGVTAREIASCVAHSEPSLVSGIR